MYDGAVFEIKKEIPGFSVGRRLSYVSRLGANWLKGSPDRIGPPSISRSPTYRGRPGKIIVVVLSLSYLMVLLWRMPAVVVRPQFWAEDGEVFYQQAHELGFLHTVITPYAGYLHLFPRLIAGLSLFVGLRSAPLLFSAAALLIQCLPAIYLSSSRMQNIGPLKVRILLALLYLGVPFVGDTYGNVTNSQWHLAVLGLLIILATPSQKLGWRLFDVTALSLGALSGPFCIFLLPVALLVWRTRRSSATVKHIGVLGFGVILQGTSLLLNGRPPMPTTLGASFSAFCKILAFQVFLTPFPRAVQVAHLADGSLASLVVSCSVTAVGLALMIYLLMVGGLEIRCLILFTGIMVAACLASPIATHVTSQWEALQIAGNAGRYWFVPRLTVAAATVWLATRSTWKPLRYTAALALVLLVIGDAIHWQLPLQRDMHFDEYAATFNALPMDSRITIPINPSGWWIRIIKRLHDRTSCVSDDNRSGAIPRTEFKDKLHAVSPETIANLLTGEVERVNGAAVANLDDPTTPVHVSICSGALIEGWAAPADPAYRVPTEEPADELFALTSSSLVKGDHLSQPARNWNTQNRSFRLSGYVVLLPPKVLRRGLQKVTLVAYSTRENTAYRFPQSLYLYVD